MSVTVDEDGLVWIESNGMTQVMSQSAYAAIQEGPRPKFYPSLWDKPDTRAAHDLAAQAAHDLAVFHTEALKLSRIANYFGEEAYAAAVATGRLRKPELIMIDEVHYKRPPPRPVPAFRAYHTGLTVGTTNCGLVRLVNEQRRRFDVKYRQLGSGQPNWLPQKPRSPPVDPFLLQAMRLLRP